MKRICCSLFLLLVLGCNSTSKIGPGRADGLAEGLTSFTLQISPENLSEDATEVSTQNDEILLLIYAGNKMIKPRLQADLVFDGTMASQTIVLESDAAQSHLFVLLEKDSEMANSALEAVVRVQWPELKKLSDSGDAIGVEKLLGDDDLLGYKVLSDLKNAAQFEIGGMQFFDKYQYSFSLRKNNR